MTRKEYQEYLASREWALKREAVRERANSRCERNISIPFNGNIEHFRCVGRHESTHHKTYANVGHEPLEDLMAVCNDCHSWLSGKTDVDATAEIYKKVLKEKENELGPYAHPFNTIPIFNNISSLSAEAHDCKRCKLYHERKKVVFGSGNPEADLMFIGEAPGADEDEHGLPFIGRAGQLLNKIVEAMGLARSTVYVTNVIKCRPPLNRNPESDEVEKCEPFLFQQIDLVRPKVIVTLGKFAAQSLLRTADPISSLRGRVFDYRGTKVIPTFHPAYLLRNPAVKRDVWDDMRKVQVLLYPLAADKDHEGSSLSDFLSQ
jgi:DNA polymerase